MLVEEFSRRAIKLVGTPVEWKPRLAHRLGVTLGEVEGWAAGRAAIPEAVATVLVDATAEPDDAAPADEWIAGRGLALTNEPPRAYLIHARRPRFVARLVGAGEPDADTAPTPAGVRRLDGETWVADVVWLDPRPDDAEFDALLDDAARALEVAHGPH